MSPGYLEDRLNLRGKVGAIVGGGGGLGRACAVDLAGCGVGLGLLDRNAALLHECETLCRAAGGDVAGLEGDARNAESLSRFFDLLDSRFGRLDVLVNVVGGTFRAGFADTTRRGWEALINTNFLWLLQATQFAVPRMKKAGGGSIISITSIEAHRAAPGFAVYAALKAAVVNFSRTLAVELAPDGIRVNTIAPDIVPTEGMAAQRSPGGAPDTSLSAREAVAIPMGRHGEYADVGGCAIFLASDLSAYVTGTSLHPDGGALASSGWLNWPGHGFSTVPPAAVVGHAATHERPAEGTPH